MVFSLPTGLSADILFGLIYPFLFISGACILTWKRQQGQLYFLQIHGYRLYCFVLHVRLMAYMATAGINACAGIDTWLYIIGR